MPDLPLDFSAISNLFCARAYQLTCVKGIDLPNDFGNFGNAVHKFAEARALQDTTDLLSLCTPIAVKFNTSLTRLLTVGSAIDLRYKFPPPLVDTANTPLVEYKFSIPYKVYKGYRIILCGTIDRIYLHENLLVFQDWKTCAACGSAATTITSGYVNSFQLPFYLYIIHKYIHQFLPSNIAELALSLQLLGRYTMIYHSLVPPKIEDTPSVSLTNADIVYIEELIDYVIPKMVSIHERPSLAPPEGSIYKLCPKCQYNSFCCVKEHDRLIELINKQPTRVYDPTNFR